MTIIFDVLHLYYLPQYLPVISACRLKGISCQLVFYTQNDPNLQSVCEKVIDDEQLDAIWCQDWTEALSVYLKQQADWIVFGNAVEDLDKIHEVSKTVLMQHGIGPKSCYYEVSEQPTTVRFVEGEHRLKRLQSMYPQGCFVDTGYAKLDAAFDKSDQSLSIETLGLDPSKKTILYAPTFYPSSIERFDKDFAERFSDYNIIIKPHFFSLTKKKYANQRRLMTYFSTYDNVYLCAVDDYNLMPFMAISDVMLSDASSAIFEFAALNKPVVWCDFYKLRWSYRGIFSFRFKNRIDSDIEYFNKVAYRATSYNELSSQVNAALNLGNKKTDLIEELAGAVDGHCSTRIVDYLLDN